MMKQKRKQVQQLRISPKLRVIIASSGVFAMAAIALVIYTNMGIRKDAEAGTGKPGVQVINTPNTILNEFTALSIDAPSGATQINVTANTLNSKGRFDNDLETGSLVMIVQMTTSLAANQDLQDTSNTSDARNSGNYEFAEVAGIEGDSKINLTAPLKNSYSAGSKSQVVRVPRYSMMSVNPGASITTDAWDGKTGGIVAIEVNGTTTINGSINVSGKGFKGTGPASNMNARILKTVMNDSQCNKIYLGKGAPGRSSSTAGCNGGGIVFILSGGIITGSGSIQADGEQAPVLPTAMQQGNGANGGSVFLFSRNSPIKNLSITANGGNTGMEIQANASASQTIFGRGGNGGLIFTSNNTGLHCSVNGGITPNDTVAENGNRMNTNAKSAPGTINSGIIFPYSKDNSTPGKIKLLTASALNGQVKVSWVTTSEENVDFFTIERSTDGQNFIPVAKLNAKGNTSGSTDYSFDDDFHPVATTWYRLSQTDKNGITESFPPAVIKMKSDDLQSRLISIKPNPFTDHFTVYCTVASAGLIEFALTNISGTSIRKETAITGIGTNTIPFENLGEIPKGIYFLSMTAGEEKCATMKMVK